MIEQKTTEIKQLVEAFSIDVDKVVTKKNKAAARRARKTLSMISKLTKELRQLILDSITVNGGSK